MRDFEVLEIELRIFFYVGSKSFRPIADKLPIAAGLFDANGVFDIQCAKTFAWLVNSEKYLSSESRKRGNLLRE